MSAILIGIIGTRVGNDELRGAVITLIVFLVLSLVAASLAVLPKLPFARVTRKPVSPNYDPFFFGHFERVPRAEYVEQMETIISSDATLYRALIENLHNQGVYLVRAKYRWVAIGYILFMAGFIVAGIVAIVTVWP